MSPPSLVSSAPHHHVWQLPLTSLDTPVHALDQDRACTRQNSHAQTRPGTPMHAPVHARRAPWTRQSVTRADAPRPHSPAPLASGRARRPATSQTSSIDRGNAMANVIVDATRHGAEHSHQARHRYRAPAAPRSRASASPGHQPPYAPTPCLFATLERRRRR
jgi:hypothetical protein